MRIKLTLCILANVLLSSSACSGAPDCFREEIFCAALVTDTRGVDDHGINQDSWIGLEQSKVNGVIDRSAYIESVDARDYEKNIAFFANSGYDVIITSGIGLRDATIRSAALHPAAVFVGMNQPDDESLPNFISVTFPEDQMGFVAGALAARLTRTQVIGAACETSGIESMWRYCEGFRAGAKYADETVKVIVVYRDDGSREKLFIDEEWGIENAQKLIESGADVIFAVGGATGVGALQAGVEAHTRVIGAEQDQGAVLGDQGSGVVTSVLGRTSFTVRELMRNVRAGNLADATLSPIAYVPFDAVVQKSVVLEMDQILAGLAAGEIKTNVTSEKP